MKLVYIFFDEAIPSETITDKPLPVILVLVLIALSVLFIVRKVRKKKSSRKEKN